MSVALTPSGSLTREGRDLALELLRDAQEEPISEELAMRIEDFLVRFEQRVSEQQ